MQFKIEELEQPGNHKKKKEKKKKRDDFEGKYDWTDLMIRLCIRIQEIIASGDVQKLSLKSVSSKYFQI